MSLTNDTGPQPPPGVLSAWFTLHRCPACGSANVRRSTLRSREAGEHALHSPYRCRACRERFWVLSRKARTLTVAGSVVGLAILLLIAFVVLGPDDEPTPYPAPPGSEDVEVLTATPPRDAARKAASARPALPKAGPAAPSAALAPPASAPPASAPIADPSPPAPATVDKPLRPPAQPFVK
jgi:hypothetical protein